MLPKTLLVIVIIVTTVVHNTVNTFDVSPLFSQGNYKFARKTLGECKNFPKGQFPCIANKAAAFLEKISQYDIPIIDGIVLKKIDEDHHVNATFRNNARYIGTKSFGVERLKSAMTGFLTNHNLALDFTKTYDEHNGDDEDAVGRSKDDKQLIGSGKFGKISRKERRYLQYALMVLMGISGLIGPFFMKTLTLIAGKALVASKIALLIVGSVALKKIFSHEDKKGSTVKVHTHTIPIHDDDHDRFFQYADNDRYFQYADDDSAHNFLKKV